MRRVPPTHDTAVVATPIGHVLINSDGEAITSIEIGVEPTLTTSSQGLAAEAARQLSAYFAGKLSVFDLPLGAAASNRGAALREGIGNIPFGETTSYGALARRLGSSARAIGQACARNAYPIVVPCHRVIGAGRTLGHYSGGAGLLTKAMLLSHEAELTGRISPWSRSRLF